MELIGRLILIQSAFRPYEAHPQVVYINALAHLGISTCEHKIVNSV